MVHRLLVADQQEVTDEFASPWSDSQSRRQGHGRNVAPPPESHLGILARRQRVTAMPRQNGRVDAEARYPDLQPADERTALTQRLDHYRAIVRASLHGLPWNDASRRLLPATDLTIAGIVKHLAWAEGRWFQGRLLGHAMPPPWDAPGADDPGAAMNLDAGDTVDGIVALYDVACRRSRSALGLCDSLSQVAAVSSFGRGPVNLRWILVHMIDETARHAGHLDLLRDHLEI
jgi:hypothetical protein